MGELAFNTGDGVVDIQRTPADVPIASSTGKVWRERDLTAWFAGEVRKWRQAVRQPDGGGKAGASADVPITVRGGLDAVLGGGSVAIEFKLARGGRLGFREVKPHQLAALRGAAGVGGAGAGVYMKLSDVVPGEKPFDAFYMALGRAFVVVGYIGTSSEAGTIVGQRRALGGGLAEVWAVDIGAWDGLEKRKAHAGGRGRASATVDDCRAAGGVRLR